MNPGLLIRIAVFLSGEILVCLYLTDYAGFFMLAGGLSILLVLLFFLSRIFAIFIALVTGITVSIVVVNDIGSFASIRELEWLYLIAYIASWLIFSIVIVSTSLSRMYKVMFLPLALGVLFFSTTGIKTNLTPIVTFSQYLTMRDGVKIAVSVYLPREFDQALPAILLQTRYHRAQDYRFPFNLLFGLPKWPSGIINKMVAKDYAFVTVDVRGSGASFGVRKSPFSEQEVLDGKEVVDWIVAQDWSNGKVGAGGHSYNGTTAEMLLRNGHPAVKAVMTRFTVYDAYTDILFPGGIVSDNFLKSWQKLNSHLDNNTFGQLMGHPTSWLLKGVRPVDEDTAGVLLKRAIEERRGSYNIDKVARQIVYREDTVDGFSTSAMSPYTYQQEIENAGAAIYSISGWFDGAYPYSAIKRFLSLPASDNYMLIGPWDHGGGQFISPCSTDKAERFRAADEALLFFDYYLKGIDNGFADRAPVRYYTMCAGSWRNATTWPTRAQRVVYYFGEGGQLSTEHSHARVAADSYQVNLDSSSGPGSRWQSYVNLQQLPIAYPDREEQDSQLLTYTSEAVTRDTEITGHPVLTMYVDSSATDGQFFVYLEELDKEGNISYITEGQLRALHRKLSDDMPPYTMLTPYRSFHREDAAPLIPGAPTKLLIPLLPTSYLVRQGHRIRIAIAGADKHNFANLPGDAPVINVFRDSIRASKLDLPVVDRSLENSAECGRRQSC